MSKTIYQERGIDVLDDGRIYSLNVNSGICTWCGYNTHEDAELKERAINHKEDNE